MTSNTSKRVAKVEVFPSTFINAAWKNSYFYRVRGANGAILCTSEAYLSKRNAHRGARALLRALGSTVAVVEVAS